ncbi:MAG TPA: tRNA epoxyqueuosine(34) reductase QueG [Desulfobacteraceae bacterium]|nr:tRNA epoxyqueuosine(34) reductase QueG [Desulfobacteraceae bacterium]
MKKQNADSATASSHKQVAQGQELLFIIKEKAKDLGFISVGFLRPQRPLFLDKFFSWVDSGRHGDMAWLERNSHLRENPAQLLDGCRTIITLAYPYSSAKPCTADGFTASRYSEPAKTDYHDRLRNLCSELSSTIKDLYPGSRQRICVDSAPILERSLAVASGIGFIGKNNMLIIPGHGSYLFLAEILTTALFPVFKAHISETQCGSCTKCMDACPSGSLEKPFLLDASRCLSYLTIEHKGMVDKETGNKMDRCFFGCDICQEVCPFNGDNYNTEISLPSIREFIDMDELTFKVKFGKTALARAGLNKIKTNIEAFKKG